jgi:hypothetical protein
MVLDFCWTSHVTGFKIQMVSDRLDRCALHRHTLSDKTKKKIIIIITFDLIMKKC